MSPVWRLVTVLSLSLLLAGASACTTPIAATTSSGGTVASASVGGGTTQNKLVDLPPRIVNTPIVVSASSGRAPTPTKVPAGTALSASSLRLPTDGKTVVMVDSTDGEGLWLRREPAGEPLKTWPDYSPMLVIGEDQTVDERVWRPVRALDGQTGWAAAEFLVPADDQTIAAVLPSLMLPSTPPAALQARVAVTEATATSAPAAAAPAQPTATATPKRPVAFIGQAAPTAPPAATSTTQAAAAVAATATPQPTATAQPTATPIRAPAGTHEIAAGDATLSVADTDRGMPVKIGSRPRAGMELTAVKVTLKNDGDGPMAVYRNSFRLVLSDRTRAEPLAGGESPLPYSALVPPGGQLEGWLTFEVPTGTKVDSLVWSPERDVTYAMGI